MGWRYCVCMLQGKHEERRSCCPTWTAWRLQVTLFWKGQSYVSFRRSKLLDVQIFLLCLSLDSCISKLELLFLCTDVEYGNGSRNTHGASNMKGLSMLFLKKRQGKLAQVLWAFCSVIITLLMNIWCNSIKINDALFDEKSSSVTVWRIACSRQSLWEKEEIFWVGLLCNIQYDILKHVVFPTSVKPWLILIIP